MKKGPNVSDGFDHIRAEMKKRGMLQPKRHGKYRRRVQVTGKTEEHIHNKIILLAYERGLPVGELVDLLLREVLESKNLLRRCLRRRESPEWRQAVASGLEPRSSSEVVLNHCKKHGIPIEEIEGSQEPR